MREKVLEEAKKIFKPEFLNRISDIVFFRPLSKDDLLKIVDLEVAKVAKRIADKKIALEFTPEAKQLLIEKGYDEKYGARPLRRAVEHYLEDPLAEAVLRGHAQGRRTGPGRARRREAGIQAEGTGGRRDRRVLLVAEPCL